MKTADEFAAAALPALIATAKPNGLVMAETDWEHVCQMAWYLGDLMVYANPNEPFQSPSAPPIMPKT